MSVGYGKPPKSGQFKKGQSGNSKGRPKKKPPEPLSPAFLFGKVMSEAIEIKTERGRCFVPRWGAIIRMLQNKALKKDVRAARLLHQIRKKFPSNVTAWGKVIHIVSEADLKL